MKYLVGFSRLFVGVLFIFSGFIKLNDPVGFSFKLEEYFSPAVFDLPFFMSFALPIAYFIVIIEILLGVMLLLGYEKKVTVWGLFSMIVFFTFLTFYSAYYNKVTDCGCFGDAIPLTPWESFTKDVILLVLIVILFTQRHLIQPLFKPGTAKLLLLIVLLGCIGMGYYVYNHLPIKDFRAYKVGVNIMEGMTVPPGAPEAIYEYAWKFKVGEEEQVIVTRGEYPDVAGDFIGVETTEVQAGYVPPIHDFTIEKSGTDHTAQMMQEEKLLMVVAYDLWKSEVKAFRDVKIVSDKALEKGYKVIGLSASLDQQTTELIGKYELGFSFYFTDETTLKTIIRANPGVLILNKGTIVQKVHHNDLEDLELSNK